MVAACVCTHSATKSCRLLNLRGSTQKLVEKHEASLFLRGVQHFLNWIRGIIKGVARSNWPSNLVVGS